jgi:chitinase
MGAEISILFSAWRQQQQRKRKSWKTTIQVAIAALSLVLTTNCNAAPPTVSQPLIVGYVLASNDRFQPGEIDPHKLTRINYAFANIEGGRMVLSAPVDSQNLATLTSLRHENPWLTVLISVGGWLGSGKFSDMALTAESRRIFVESAAEVVKRYDLDGLDVDWEYPGMPGAGNPYRAEDKQNFTALMKELRDRLDQDSKTNGRRLYLTFAAAAFEEYLDHTEMDKVQRYVDTVNLMTYDSYEAGSDAITGNHAPLFADPADPKGASADAIVQSFEKAGVPAAKVLLGVPFYGRMWGEVPDQNHGLFQKGKKVPDAYAPYRLIATRMLNHGFARYWDSAASVPYLYNYQTHVFVSYEDPESLAAKCSYVLNRKLGGVMFWEYFDDNSGKLLNTINQSLHAEHQVSTAR